MSEQDRDVRSFDRYISKLIRGPCARPFPFEDKDNAISIYIGYMLLRTQSMFRWSGLPDTIPVEDLELMLQANGSSAITEVSGSLYAFTGGLGGEYNAYYRPTICTVANPYLQFESMLRIGEDCVLVRNDPLYMGLLPMCSRYASQLAEADLSISLATINARLIEAIAAPDDATYKSALKFLDDVRAGKPGVILENAFLDGIRSLPLSGSGNVFGPLIELTQYIKASWFNELGLNANYNMKREAIMSGEAQLNNDALTPLIDIMLNERKRGADEINAKYGTSISVELASAWESNDREEEAELEQIEKNADQEGGDEPDETAPTE